MLSLRVLLEWMIVYDLLIVCLDDRNAILFILQGKNDVLLVILEPEIFMDFVLFLINPEHSGQVVQHRFLLLFLDQQVGPENRIFLD